MSVDLCFGMRARLEERRKTVMAGALKMGRNLFDRSFPVDVALFRCNPQEDDRSDQWCPNFSIDMTVHDLTVRYMYLFIAYCVVFPCESNEPFHLTTLG